MASLFRKIPIKHFSNIIIRNKSQVNKGKPNFIIVRPSLEEYDEILCLMDKSYYTEEPTTSSIGFRPSALFDEQTIQDLSEGYSLVAKCKYDGSIMGVSINKTTHCWDPDVLDKLACIVPDVKSRQLLHFYSHVYRSPDLWQKYCTSTVFEICYLFVRRDARKKGIAYKLAEESRSLGADCGFPVVSMYATSDYTAKLAERMGMKMVGEIPYCSYVGPDQKPIFNPPDPHKALKVYVDDQPQKNAKLKK